MSIGLSQRIPLPRNGSSVSDQSKMNQQIAQGGGSDVARDQVTRNTRKKQAMRLLGRRIVMQKLQDEIGVGRAAATKKTKG